MCEQIPGEYTAPPLENVVHATTDKIIQQLLSHNQELMLLLNTANISTSNRKYCCPRPSSGPLQGQPCIPTPSHYNIYCWMHGGGDHNGCDCNAKAPGHKDDEASNNKRCGMTYSCTE